MPMNKPLSTSALILLLIALAAFHWRDSILGRVSDVHTSAVGDNRAVQRILPAANPAQINAFVKNREMAQVTQPATPPVTVPATDPLPVTQAGGQAPQTQTAQAPAPRTPQPTSGSMPKSISARCAILRREAIPSAFRLKSRVFARFIPTGCRRPILSPFPKTAIRGSMPCGSSIPTAVMPR